jgi:L-ascorbate metabolism protein UlaG (beta-lactamase superfamily)
LFKAYEDARVKGNHIVAKSGEKIPLQGMDVRVVTAGAKPISAPLEGAGAPNSACANIKPRNNDESEDGQSVGLLIGFGKFRFVHLGDLTWNLINQLFCPNNLVGPVDVYLTTHHGMVMPQNVAQIRPMPCCSEDWSRSCCSEAELRGLHPRVAIFNVGEHYHKGGTPKGWQAIHSTPRLEDIWQTHYQAEGGQENNTSEQFIANLKEKDCKGYWIKLSADADGSFTITNTRNGYTKKYPAKKGGLL